MVVQSPTSTKKVSRRARISMRTIRTLATVIAEKFDPDEIILFGSHAYGTPHAWSDVDFLVVMDTPKGEVKTILEISDALPYVPFRVDIIARSRESINRRTKSGDFFLREITKKGKVLYARGD
jgi:predicted nucleotidyltransferase